MSDRVEWQLIGGPFDGDTFSVPAEGKPPVECEMREELDEPDVAIRNPFVPPRVRVSLYRVLTYLDAEQRVMRYVTPESPDAR